MFRSEQTSLWHQGNRKLNKLDYVTSCRQTTQKPNTIPPFHIDSHNILAVVVAIFYCKSQSIDQLVVEFAIFLLKHNTVVIQTPEYITIFQTYFYVIDKMS